MYKGVTGRRKESNMHKERCEKKHNKENERLAGKKD